MAKTPLAATLAVLLSFTGCSAGVPYASLPRDATIGAGDPTRAAIIGSAFSFATPGILAGHPEAAAIAAAQVEYLAGEIPTGPRWVELNPTVGLELMAARAEMRSALGIAADAQPQAVVDGLFDASRALTVGKPDAARQALAAPAFADGSGTLLRLAGLPALPRTRSATALAEREMFRTEQDSQHSSGGNGTMF